MPWAWAPSAVALAVAAGRCQQFLFRKRKRWNPGTAPRHLWWTVRFIRSKAVFFNHLWRLLWQQLQVGRQ